MKPTKMKWKITDLIKTLASCFSCLYVNNMVGRTFKVNYDSQTLNNSKSYGFIEDQSVWTRWKLPIIGTLRWSTFDQVCFS